MKEGKYILCWCGLFVGALNLCAQQAGTAVQHFLDFPVSAHQAALGGHTVAYQGTDAMFGFTNPGALSTDADKLLYLNYAIYMANTGYGSAAYATRFSTKDAFMAGFQFAQYGKMQGYDSSGNPTGEFTALDFAFDATYSRWLNRYFTVGLTWKPVFSVYERYTSFSMGCDIGVLFHDPASLVSAGLSLTNIGGRLYQSEEVVLGGKWLPMNLAVGVSKRLKHAPFTFHLTLQQLQQWDRSYATNGTEPQQISVGELIGRKFIVGVDVSPVSDRFWVALSYNFDRGLSLANPYVLSVAGLSGGAGVRLYMFRLEAAVACYSTAAVTGHFTVAVDLNGFNKRKL